MHLKKYITLTRAGILDSLQFRLSTFTIILGNIIYMTIVYFLWKSIYASADSYVINGMTFMDTLIYLVLATAIFSFMEMYLVWEMGKNIQTGKIILDLLKPIEYRSYSFWSLSGNLVMSFVMTFIPTFIIVFFMTKFSIHLGLNLLFFTISVIMAIIINFSIDFMVGTICIYTESIWGINIMKEVIVLLLSGATIPIAFFPKSLKAIVRFLPFQSIYNAPLSLLIDNKMALSDVGITLGVQLLWCILMLIISKLFWKLSLKQITVNGG